MVDVQRVRGGGQIQATDGRTAANHLCSRIVCALGDIGKHVDKQQFAPTDKQGTVTTLDPG
jgi:hypothetical protein